MTSERKISLEKTKLIIGILILLLLSVPSLVKAQFSLVQNNFSGGMGYLRFGSAHLQLGDFYTQLKGADLPVPSKNFTFIGGVGYGIVNNFIFGGGSTILGGILNKDLKSSSRLSVNQGMLYFGYVLYQMEKLLLYPMIGIGASRTNLRIKSNFLPSSFNGFLKSPYFDGNISNTNFLFNFELNADYFLTGIIQQSKLGGWLGGFSLGYLVSPFKTGWSIDGNTLLLAPSTRTSEFYFTIKLGGGGFRLKKALSMKD